MGGRNGAENYYSIKALIAGISLLLSKIVDKGGDEMEHRKLNAEELSLLYNFIESLKNEDVDLFWSCLSERCKELIKTEVDFFSGKDKTEVLKMVKDHYGEELEHLGIGNMIRFTNEELTRGFGFFQTNVKTNIHYPFGASDVHGMEIPLEFENGEFKINILKKN
ncbi:hypothetical protein [Virgibacillus doumboii]|uniref:hypothetical protein n=1 Tax=Virgibacillus doumboii TaxID=2697503 RepID=UPI0013DF8CFE|nr:hypothetical protein [Virgibacillus doumboii]